MRREFKRKGEKKKGKQKKRDTGKRIRPSFFFFYFNFIRFFFFCFLLLVFCFFFKTFFFFRNCKRRDGMGKIWEEGDKIKKSLEDGLCVFSLCTYVWLCV